MKDSARYAKLVEWSDEDQCYIGSALGLTGGGCCHGDDERKVFKELCVIADEIVALIKEDGKPLPPATAGRGIGMKLTEAA